MHVRGFVPDAATQPADIDVRLAINGFAAVGASGIGVPPLVKIEIDCVEAET